MKTTSLFILVFFGYQVMAQDALMNTDKKGYMADRYDVVAYFSDKAIKGKEKHEVSYKGAKYLFDSEENKNTFLANPDKYTPEYGGYCAYAMAKTGEKIGINPRAFEVRNGKLYLFYKTPFSDTYEDWLTENPKALIHRANRNWHTLVAN
ncbi:MAG: YHS domain-containing protein [Bacteroidetes bacterium]|nr:YHS domain-containing protein [Bacteroidota bacterium]